MTKVYIVWTNDAKVEGVVFRDKGDAMWTSTGNPNYLGHCYPSLGYDLREMEFGNINTNDLLPMDEVTLNEQV